MEDVTRPLRPSSPKKSRDKGPPSFNSSSSSREGRPYRDPGLEVVRATVPETDDPSLPTLTFRFWVLGVLFTCVLGFVNQFFWFRETPLSVGIMVVQLLSYPLGKAMARLLPHRSIYLPGPAWLRRLTTISLNPGPFNLKEHVLITVCANAAGGTAYAIDIIVIKRIFYRSDMGFLGSFLLIISTQCLGYGMAGMTRTFLVKPPSMIWPANLVNVALFRTLHEDQSINPSSPYRVTRTRFFFIVTSASFAYYFLPGFLATFLSTISLLCYMAPSSRVSHLLGSGTRGLGILSFSLDWNTIVSFLGSPLITPFWAQCNMFIGFILITWGLIPLGYFSNTWQAKTFPILSSKLFQVDGTPYEPLELLDPKTLTLNEAVYDKYGPLRLSYFFAVTYGLGFATLSAVMVHTLLYHGGEIRPDEEDIHTRLMRAYPEVPDSWYLGIFIVNLAIAILVCEVFDINLPWWGVLLAVGMAALFLLPIGIITAITNQTPGLNIITEFVIGFILPGRPIANVTFKTYGYISMVQAISLVGDLKLGHYMKIPPRHMFLAQIIGTILAGLINLGTAYGMFHLVPNLCTESAGEWSCASANVFYAASVIWGVVGPARMFGPGSPYNTLLWCFLLGALLPVPFWLMARRQPASSFWARIHIPILLSATSMMPPAHPSMYPSWFLIGATFGWAVYRYRRSWWERYNYVLSAGLDSGVALAGIVIFFAFQYREVIVDWWGTRPDCGTMIF
ncbi:MAG: oligopeptide transporter OPT family [Piptocephalis tieghemiana]|nr:MAG: oligopeptide transporter OPT family [Piptocephalis tieghemiana]